MWASLVNFFRDKIFNKAEIKFPSRSDNDCNYGLYGKRLKLSDSFTDSRDLIDTAEYPCLVYMQQQNENYNDEEECCVVAEMPRRKKPGKLSQTSQTLESSLFQKDSSQNDSSKEFVILDNPDQEKDKNIEIVKWTSFSKDRAKAHTKNNKFFNSPRVPLAQSKLAKSRLSYKNHLRRNINCLQENYLLSEKLQYIKLLQSHMSFFSDVLCQRKSFKVIPVIDLTEDIDKRSSSNKLNNAEDQDVQIIGEVRGIRSFQDMLKARSIDTQESLENQIKNKPELLDLEGTEENTISLLDDDDEDVEKTGSEDLEEKLRDFMYITNFNIQEEQKEISESHFLPKLTSEQEEKIVAALIPQPGSEILVRGFGINISRRDMQTLKGLNWLNDEIINFYMNLIMERSKSQKTLPKVFAFNTFFYPKLVTSGYVSLKRWTKKIDIFSFDLILVPVHLGMHWCLAVIDFRCKSIQYYDSIGSPNDLCLDRLLLYLKVESLDKRKKILCTTDWEKLNMGDIPQQMNGSDCGVFSCMFAEYSARDAAIVFSQDNMPYFRKKMVIEILEKKLIT